MNAPLTRPERKARRKKERDIFSGRGKGTELIVTVDAEPSEKLLCGVRRVKAPGALEEGSVSCRSCLVLLGRLEPRTVESFSGKCYEIYMPRSGASK